MTRLHRRSAAIALAKASARADGTIPAHVVKTVAAGTGVSERTLWRWLSPTPDQAADATDEQMFAGDAMTERACRNRARWTPSRDQLLVVAGAANLAEAHRDLEATDPTVPSYPTFRRAVARCDAGIAAAITRRGGAPALTRTRMYLTVTVAHRNERWVMDSQEVPVRTLAPGDHEPRKYWQTTALDEASRMVMATVLTADRPTSADVTACIATGIRGWTAADGTFVGGVPQQIVWDNAGEFLAEDVTTMALNLAFTGTAVTPYAPYEKGKIEAWHKTSQVELYAKLPGSSHGPRTASDKEIWRPADGQLLTGDLLTAHALLWVEHYNCERPHSSLDGQTPLQRWAADTAGLRTVPDTALYDAMLLAGRRRMVSKNGIRFRTLDYVAAELNSVVGRSVELRYLPHDESFVEVFLDGEHLCTAHQVHRMTPGQRSALLRTRRTQYVTARQLLTDAAALRLRRHEDALTDTALAGAGPVLPPLSASRIDDPRDADPNAFLDAVTEPDPTGTAATPAPEPATSDPRAADPAAFLSLDTASAPGEVTR